MENLTDILSHSYTILREILRCCCHLLDSGMWHLGAADRHESEDVVPGTTLWQNTEMQK